MISQGSHLDGHFTSCHAGKQGNIPVAVIVMYGICVLHHSELLEA